ncbi:hypothetical protein LR69_04347 [Geobacillus sp. BCO2]|nr:hypothetical protein LR69_04347 [Geobacillus sp. BCO2]
MKEDLYLLIEIDRNPLCSTPEVNVDIYDDLQKKRLKAHGFNRGMKDGMTR